MLVNLFFIFVKTHLNAVERCKLKTILAQNKSNLHALCFHPGGRHLFKTAGDNNHAIMCFHSLKKLALTFRTFLIICLNNGYIMLRKWLTSMLVSLPVNLLCEVAVGLSKLVKLYTFTF